MTESPKMPDPEQLKRTLARCRHRLRELELSKLELEELIAMLEKENRERRKQQLQKFLSMSEQTLE